MDSVKPTIPSASPLKRSSQSQEKDTNASSLEQRVTQAVATSFSVTTSDATQPSTKRRQTFSMTGAQLHSSSGPSLTGSSVNSSGHAQGFSSVSRPSAFLSMNLAAILPLPTAAPEESKENKDAKLSEVVVKKLDSDDTEMVSPKPPRPFSFSILQPTDSSVSSGERRLTNLSLRSPMRPVNLTKMLTEAIATSRESNRDGSKTVVDSSDDCKDAEMLSPKPSRPPELPANSNSSSGSSLLKLEFGSRNRLLAANLGSAQSWGQNVQISALGYSLKSVGLSPTNLPPSSSVAPHRFVPNFAAFPDKEEEVQEEYGSVSCGKNIPETPAAIRHKDDFYYSLRKIRQDMQIVIDGQTVGMEDLLGSGYFNDVYRLSNGQVAKFPKKVGTVVASVIRSNRNYARAQYEQLLKFQDRLKEIGIEVAPTIFRDDGIIIQEFSESYVLWKPSQLKSDATPLANLSEYQTTYLNTAKKAFAFFFTNSIAADFKPDNLAVDPKRRPGVLIIRDFYESEGDDEQILLNIPPLLRAWARGNKEIYEYLDPRPKSNT